AWAAEQLLRSASRVIVQSEIERDRLLGRTPGLNIVVLPNAVSTVQFPLPERQSGRKTIIYLGRMDESKGLSDMVEVSRLLIEQGFKFRFNCYGTGPDKDKFVASMSEVLGENFRYGGVVAGQPKTRALAEADIFLMPSRFEGLPMALLEAMASGCVPVVSNRGSIPTAVDDSRNGFLIEPGDITQIVGKLKFLLSEGETGWEGYRRHARETVRERFDIVGYVEKLNAIYRESVSSR
ncbi:MAG TPA: glycosyltransferase family 4 protein, partial [Pyrinomonadaceae bacterium]|nr:glycosyltransferase family 4 protein [Pyrinomonadaceae bacterium]